MAGAAVRDASTGIAFIGRDVEVGAGSKLIPPNELEMPENLLQSQSGNRRPAALLRQCHSLTAESEPPRVIHVVAKLDRTAVETWLLRMLSYAAKIGAPVDWTFYCTDGRGALDERALALGAQVVCSPVPIGAKLEFMRALRSHLSLNRYDVLHSHHDVISGVYLLAASHLPIKRRIVHVHNADESVLTPSAIKQRLFRPTLRRICLTLADKIAANSNHCLDTFLAGRKRHTEKDVVHYYGIDPEPLINAKPDRADFRRQHGFAQDARIVLFAGRMVPEKNPVFAVDVIAEMHRIDPLVVGIFAGSGSLEDDVRARAAELGVEPWIRCLGWRNDVPQLMNGCDWFILPHPEHPPEGFGIAVVEAQLAGLRLLLSNGVADDPLLPTASVRRLRLRQSPADWAMAALELWSAPAPSREAALGAFQRSPMAMDHAFRDLVRLHGQ
jgi:glycosyltransferase involved in cell wall biosynthesis